MDRKDLNRELKNYLVVLRAGGRCRTHLIVGILSTPRPRRRLGKSAFENYETDVLASQARPDADHFANDSQVTEQIVRKNAAQNDMAANSSQSSDTYQWLYPESSVHEFPTPIRSIYVGPHSSDQSSARTSSYRLCIRTHSSTLFADLIVPRRVLSAADAISLLPLRLAGLLEIKHGKDCVLTSHVDSVKRKYRGDCRAEVNVTHSDANIVDVCFCPGREDLALTIDARGQLGTFGYDVVEVAKRGWRTPTHWSPMLIGLHKDEISSDMQVVYLHGGQYAFLKSSSHVRLVDLHTLQTDKVFATGPEGSAVVDIGLSAVEGVQMIWILTESEVVVLDARKVFLGHHLLIVPHERSGSGSLQMTCVEDHPLGHTVLVTSTGDRLATVLTVALNADMPVAHLSHQQALTLAGSDGETPISQLLMIDASYLDRDWRAALQGKVLGNEEGMTFGALHLSSGECLWLSGYGAGRCGIGNIQYSGRQQRSNAQRAVETSDSQIEAARKLHHLPALYNTLFAATGERDEETCDQLTPEDIQKVVRYIESRPSNATPSLAVEILNKVFEDSHKGMKPTIWSTEMYAQNRLRTTLAALLRRIVQRSDSTALTEVIQDHLATRIPNDVSEIETSCARMLKYLSTDRHKGGDLPLELLHRHEIVTERQEEASTEVVVDLLLSSICIESCREVNDNETETAQGKEETYIDQYRQTFNVKPQSKGKTFKKISDAARHLVDDWKLGADPRSYQFEDDLSNAEDTVVTPLVNSQYSSRAGSQVPHTFIPLPLSVQSPSLASSQDVRNASQPASEWPGADATPRSLTASMPIIAQAQDNFAEPQSSQQRKKRKKRVGGF